MSDQVQTLRELAARNATRVSKLEQQLEHVAQLVRAFDEDWAEYDRRGGDLRLARRSFRNLVAWQKGDLATVVCDRLACKLSSSPSPLTPRISPTRSLVDLAGHDLGVIELHAATFERENTQRQQASRSQV